jgi:hypothetical protein
MTFALLFAIILILWAVGWGLNWGGQPWGAAYGNNFVIWLLFVLLGWHVFGPLIHP